MISYAIVFMVSYLCLTVSLEKHLVSYLLPMFEKQTEFFDQTGVYDALFTGKPLTAKTFIYYNNNLLLNSMLVQEDLQSLKLIKSFLDKRK